uniref:Major facilitator superfamily (MFS) profile domain-containing protein n=1 Tax=Globisporangium ultimum (strain ATCC 200006 / CBS 805.95 / DAOM BR144) TaxID=431595 RepID=K3WGI7_GLOUD
MSEDDAYHALHDHGRTAAGAELKRVALVVAVLASDLLLAGIIWGWAPLLLMLQDEKQYFELCSSSDTPNGNGSSSSMHSNESSVPTCDAQENKLNLVYAIASVVLNAVAPAVGFLLDHIGPKFSVALAGCLEVSGLVLLALADSQSFDVFIPAYSLVAVGGIMTLMASFPASFLIMSHQTLILAAINCLMDGSSVVFLVLYTIKNHTSLTRQELLGSLAVLATANYIALVALWHVNESALRRPVEGEDVASTQESTTSENYEEHCTSVVEAPSFRPVTLTDCEYGVEGSMASTLERQGPPQSPIGATATPNLMHMPIRQQLRTFEFAYVVAFAAVHGMRITLYIGTTNKLLENYGDREYHNSLFTKIFSIVLPLGFLFVPAVDHIVEHKGLLVSLFFTSGLGLVYNALALVRNLYVQCVTFFLFTGFRVLLFTVLSCFTAKTFGLATMGSLMGIIFSLGAIVNLLEYPAVYVSNTYFDGDLSLVYGLTLLLCVLLIPLTEYLRRHWQDRDQKLLLQQQPFSTATRV